MGGATNARGFLERFGPNGLGLRVAGLCDANEEGWFRRGLERAGFGPVPSRTHMEAMGFYVCDADLEDELIRAVGVEGMEALIDGQGELASFRVMQRQPAQRGRAVDQQLRRFMGARSGHKLQYGRLLAEAVELAAIPEPLVQVLAAVG